MAAWFDRASTKGLDILASPLTTFPLSMGCWFNLPAIGIGTQCIMSASIAAGGNYVTGYVDNAGVITVEKTGGGVVTCGTYTAGDWWYMLIRLISATSIRASTLSSRTMVQAVANNTSAGTMTGFTAISLGNFRLTTNNTNHITGGIGEFFLTNNDCFSGGGQGTDASYLRDLAYRGPLSYGRILDGLIEYRSFFSTTADGKGDEVLVGRRGRQDWTNQNTVIAGPHPPLPPPYIPIRPLRKLLLV